MLVLVIAFLLVFWVDYYMIIRFEEMRLLHLFGKEYERYTQQVPRLIPRFRNYRTRDRLEMDAQRNLLGIVKSMRFFGLAFALKLIEVLKEVKL